MIFRYTTHEDYNLLSEWNKFFRFPTPPREALPENGLGGIVLMKNDVSVCMGFIYATNSSIAWMEWISSNPEYREPDRKEMIEALIRELCREAKNAGFATVFSTVKNENLVKRFEAAGFIVGSSCTKEMIFST